ncbi:glycosyltransferase family 39 protein [Methylomonas montana]|uniref:ArnT family glycosyltransferase n=1 Tax=Methylomonas montana TaxID=3058963 RepID=UPI002659CEB8|nr:glycosyltransferase family 39 protein [Methylomonas montana]WKJ89367.1 glycosyltransferase family 39 protein [Methylomonas montana]
MTIPGNAIYRWGIFPLWLLLSATVFFRSPIPIDETRYLSVAWEMWLRGDFLVPHLNGQAYSHKPPLLFWLIQAGWGLFGVNDWWPRLVGPLSALVNLLLIRKLAEKLWPASIRVALLAPWILIATLLWTLFASSTMFDILLTGCVLLGMLGVLEAMQGSALKGFAMVAAAIGLGILVKGPVIFLHVLPTAVLVFVWVRRPLVYTRWFGCLFAAVLMGVLIALAWAIPAAIAGGEEYANAILWHQTADRAVGTKIHTRSLFWYLPFLPMFLFPWLFWPGFWSGLRGSRFFTDSGLRFCLVWLVSTFVVFSLLPSKQVHYLIPMLPAFALLVARLVAQAETTPRSLVTELILPALFAAIGVFLVLLPRVPGLSRLNWVQTVQSDWGLSVLGIAVVLAVSTGYRRKLSVAGISTALVAAIFVGFIFFFRYTGLAYDLRPAALQVKAFNEQHIPYAFVGNYQGQLNFLGRLPEPLPIVQPDQIVNWAAQHSDGYLISLEKDKPVEAFYWQPHREYWLVFRGAGQAEKVKPL